MLPDLLCALMLTGQMLTTLLAHTYLNSEYLFAIYTIFNLQGVFFRWYPPKKLKYGKPRLGESTLT